MVQNNEPSHFLALFKGAMVVRDGGISKTGKDSRDGDGVALFQVCGDAKPTPPLSSAVSSLPDDGVVALFAKASEMTTRS